MKASEQLSTYLSSYVPTFKSTKNGGDGYLLHKDDFNDATKLTYRTTYSIFTPEPLKNYLINIQVDSSSVILSNVELSGTTSGIYSEQYFAVAIQSGGAQFVIPNSTSSSGPTFTFNAPSNLLEYYDSTNHKFTTAGWYLFRYEAFDENYYLDLLEYSPFANGLYGSDWFFNSSNYEAIKASYTTTVTQSFATLTSWFSYLKG